MHELYWCTSNSVQVLRADPSLALSTNVIISQGAPISAAICTYSTLTALLSPTEHVQCHFRYCPVSFPLYLLTDLNSSIISSSQQQDLSLKQKGCAYLSYYHAAPLFVQWQSCDKCFRNDIWDDRGGKLLSKRLQLPVSPETQCCQSRRNICKEIRMQVVQNRCIRVHKTLPIKKKKKKSHQYKACIVLQGMLGFTL